MSTQNLFESIVSKDEDSIKDALHSALMEKIGIKIEDMKKEIMEKAFPSSKDDTEDDSDDSDDSDNEDDSDDTDDNDDSKDKEASFGAGKKDKVVA